MQEAASHPTGPQSPSALSAAGIGRSRFAGGSVKFFHGPMDCGKSTLALQLDYNHARQGRHGLLLTRLDRSGPARISSRMGLSRPAVEVDVYAFGIATDFRGRLFAGSARLFELADVVLPLQVEVLCWCGRIGRFNGRVIDGYLVRDGATVVVADTVPAPDGSADDSPGGGEASALPAADGNTRGDAPARTTAHPAVRYQVLCRAHHRSGQLGPDGSAD